ncbi:MAG: ATP-binding protein [Patescibacteria group bacterium]|nr:ATP-binding protein [Patescibacteria group bacterium]
MKVSFFYYLEQLKAFSKTPEIWSLLAVLFLALLTVFVGFFYLPLFLAIITTTIFIGIAIFLVRLSLSSILIKKEVLFKESELETIIEYLHDGIIIYGLNFKILKLNKAAQEIFQIKEEEIVDQIINPDWIKNPKFKSITQVIFPSLAPTVHQLSEPDNWPQIVEILTDEPVLSLETTLHRLIDNNKPIGFLKVVKDRTREKSILQSKTEFIDVAAHQLRTPLTAINWALENLKKITLNSPPEAKEILDQAMLIAGRALKITNDLLDASKIEDGKFGYNFKNVDFVSFIKEIIGTAEPIAKQHQVTIFFVDSFTKPLFLNIDPERMGTAILNVIENAIKYNIVNGKVKITLSEEENRPFVKVIIEDTGVGIPEEDSKKLFKKFHRGANVQQLEPNGSGLGLYITKNIIERHGGEIGFNSILNRGTKFWISLPIDQNLIPKKEFSYDESL